MQSLPLVSIIIPYNKPRYLEQAIESIKNQTYPNIEIIEVYGSKHTLGENFNKGIELSNGEYIRFLCDDDLLPPNSIYSSVILMESNPDAMWHIGNVIELHDGKEIFKRQHNTPSFEKTLENNQIHGGSLFYRRDVFKDRMWDSKLLTAEEYEFSLYLLSNGFKYVFNSTPTYIYRRHDAQKSLGKKANQKTRQNRINKIKQKYAK